MAFANRLAAMPLAQAQDLIAHADISQITLGVSSALLHLGNTIISKQPADALVLYQEEEAIGLRLNNPVTIAKGLFDEGDARRIMGDQEAALELYDHSVAAYIAAKSEPAQLGAVYASRAVIKRNMGDMEGAIEDGNLAYNTARTAGDEVGMARALNNLGTAEKGLGRYSSARNHFEEGLRLARAHNQKQGEGYLLNNIAETYVEQQNYQLALDFCLQAVKIKEEIGNKGDLVTSLTSLARIYHQAGRNVEALQTIERATVLARESGRTQTVAIALSGWGTIEDDQKHFDSALSKINEAVAISRKSGQLMDANEAEQQAAYIEFHLGHFDDAIRDANATLAFAKTYGLKQNIILSSYTLGVSQLKLANLEASHTNFQLAVDTIESMRDDVAGGSQARAEFFAQRAEVYRYLVAVDVQQLKFEDALHISELEKGRELLDMLTQGKTSLSTDLTPEEKAEEKKLNAHLTVLEGQRSRLAAAPTRDAARITALDQQLSAAQAAISSFRERIYAAHPEVRRHRGDAELITLPQVAALLPNSSTAIVEFEEAQDATYVFVITPAPGKPLLHVYSVPISGAALDSRIKSFQTALTTRDPAFSAAAASLYRLLLGPAKADLAGKKTLIIVPSGELWHLPFQALLTAPGKYLIDSAAVSYAPSLSVLRAYAAKRAGSAGAKTLLALGDPGNDLPEADREVHTLAAIYGPAQTRTFTGTAANKQNFFANAATYDVVHLATHGTFDDRNPMYSHLLMAGAAGASPRANTAQLDASEIAEMKLKASLVVLSACETAKGQYQAGEGLIGLSWSFLAAGSQSAVASQWRVESSSTTELMIAFHRALEHHMSKAEALRHAEMQIERDPKHRHPFYWAGFVLLGSS